MTAWYLATNFLLLGALLAEKKLRIANPVFITSTYNVSYYNDRTVCLQKCIKEYRFRKISLI
jgi:hypothetical protein